MNQTSARYEKIILQIISIAVIGNGLTIIAITLLNQLHLYGLFAADELLVSLPLVSGLTLVYLGTLLHRRKQAAWAVVIPLYTFILGVNVMQLARFNLLHHPWIFTRNIGLPLAVVATLICYRRVFTVKSAIQNFSISLRVIVAMLAIILLYGTSGYLLLDQRDFHQEISITQALHHTIDQIDLTTQQPLTTYTKRGTVFTDSLNILSVAALGYIIIALFQPIRAKFTSQTHNRAVALELLKTHSTDSEDFFKLWPHDKSYFVSSNQNSLLAYRVQRGVALVVGEPIGAPTHYPRLMREFLQACQLNDWLPAFIHIPKTHMALYEAQGLQLQKIGEEAIVQTAQFVEATQKTKYFRQISNKFEKHGYTIETLKPPHAPAVIARLLEVSEGWLSLPNRQERGFMMGVCNEAYLQQCTILVARDAAGTIQAFINELPVYQSQEANFDLLRHTTKALGNVNDYLLMAFIADAHRRGFSAVNLGLCPLSGLDKDADGKSMVGSAMRFIYANGNRFYSFSGLRRFKAKYEPDWRSRYIAYKPGTRNFSRVMYALNLAMSRTK